MPVAFSTECGPERAPGRAAETASSVRILAVSVDRDIALPLESLLRAAGCEVCLVNSPDEALAAIDALPPALILLEAGRAAGALDFCRLLKGCPDTAAIPVILITHAGERELRSEGLRLGADDFLILPFQPEEWLERIQLHEGRSRRRDHDLLLRNFSGRCRSEAVAIESERRLRDLADRAPLAIWIMGPGSVLTFYNRRTVLFAGREMSQIAAGGWRSLIHPEDRSAAYSRYLAAAAARRCFRIECRMRRANGRYRWVVHTATPRFVNGVFSGYIGASMDITDLKRNQERQLADGKHEGLSVLTAGIAHDFNNLLSTIFVEADLASSGLSGASPARENIERIGAVATRASGIVRLLMAYAGDGEIERQPVDLSLCGRETLQLLKSSLPKNTAIEARLDFGTPPVCANPPQIRQVILNLLTNAVEALASGNGTITIVTGALRVSGPSAGDWGEDLPEGDYGHLSVSDTGSGMTAEVRARIFDPYYTTKFLGRGLGLAMVHGIIRSHGGAIRVSSGPAGSTFEIVLPCAHRNARPQRSDPYLSMDVDGLCTTPLADVPLR
jgi:PAS domain S-box-containing protein